MEYTYFNVFLAFLQNIMRDTAIIGNWLVTDTSFGLSPILLIGATGLITFISVSIIKWLI